MSSVGQRAEEPSPSRQRRQHVSTKDGPLTGVQTGPRLVVALITLQKLSGRATSSAAPRAQSGARHGAGTLALADDRHVIALRAIRGRLSVAPSNRG
jgi:hypothetical protein